MNPLVVNLWTSSQIYPFIYVNDPGILSQKDV